ERVDRLVLINSMVGSSAADTLSAYGRAGDPVYPMDESLRRLWHTVEAWGDAPEVMVDNFCPSQNGNPAFIRWIARYQRQSASPADIRRQVESILGLDANQRLVEITAPTLVMNVMGDRLIHPTTGRFLADKIPGARLVELAGEDDFFWVMPNWREGNDYWIEFVTRAITETSRE